MGTEGVIAEIDIFSTFEGEGLNSLRWDDDVRDPFSEELIKFTRTNRLSWLFDEEIWLVLSLKGCFNWEFWL